MLPHFWRPSACGIQSVDLHACLDVNGVSLYISSMAQSFLELIKPEVLARVEALKRGTIPAVWEARALQREVKANFCASVSRPDTINIIAEIKKASPSRGIIREDFDPMALARAYESHGAVALSVLTEEKHFLGDIRFLEGAASITSLPVLRKDFILDEVQVAEARLHGAAAVLLIVAFMEQRTLRDLMAASRKYFLDALVEVHDADELETATAAGATLIGVNNRDLKTLKVDLKVSERLIARKGPGHVFIAESGLSTPEQLRNLRAMGFDGFLIGEHLMRSTDPGEELDRLRGVI